MLYPNMKYDEIYPEAKEGFISSKHERYPPVVKFGEAGEDEEPHRCSCGAETDWVNATATRFVCSMECNKKLWDSMFNIFIVQQIAGAF